MKHKLLTCIRTIMLFVLLSISAGPAIWLIAKFIDMLGACYLCGNRNALFIGMGGVSWDGEYG